MMKTMLFALLCTGCVDQVVDNTVGGSGIGIAPDLGYVYNCDLIVQIGDVPGVNETHDLSTPCLDDGPAGQVEIDDYVQNWIDGDCTAAIKASGAPDGNCLGRCHESNSLCWVR